MSDQLPTASVAPWRKVGSSICFTSSELMMIARRVHSTSGAAIAVGHHVHDLTTLPLLTAELLLIAAAAAVAATTAAAAAAAAGGEGDQRKLQSALLHPLLQAAARMTAGASAQHKSGSRLQQLAALPRTSKLLPFVTAAAGADADAGSGRRRGTPSRRAAGGGSCQQQQPLARRLAPGMGALMRGRRLQQLAPPAARCVARHLAAARRRDVDGGAQLQVWHRVLRQPHLQFAKQPKHMDGMGLRTT